MKTEVMQQWGLVLDQLEEAVKDGHVDRPELGRIIGLLLKTGVALVERAGRGGTTKQDRKALVAEMASELYERIIRPIDLQDIPNWQERLVVDPAFAKIFPKVVSSLYEELFEDWFDNPPVNYDVLLENIFTKKW